MHQTISMDISLSRCKNSQVVSDEDLLTLILLRVPWRKLMCFKSVSRQWLSLITSPHFTRLRSLLPLRASGLFIQRPPYFHSPDKVYFVPLDDANTFSPFRTLNFTHDLGDRKRIHLIQSCHGLLLCTAVQFVSRVLFNCYVYNPSTNQLTTLPKHSDLDHFTSVHYIGIAFDPSKSLHYKVIARIRRPVSNHDQFHIYSSETRTWRVSGQPFISAPGMYVFNSVYCNGRMHWLIESAVSDCLYFDVDEERLGTFPRPPIGKRLTSVRVFGQSEDHLHVIEVFPYATSLGVYEMESDYSGWFVKYRVDLAPLFKAFPDTTTHNSAIGDKNSYPVGVLSLIRRENSQEDSFLVLDIPGKGKVIHYNLVDGSFKVICELGVEFYQKSIRFFPGLLQVHQYMESLSCA